MGDNNMKAGPGPHNGVSLRELIIKMVALIRYLLHKWLIIVVVVLLGAVLGLCYSLFKKTNYTATLSFVMDEPSGSQGGLGAAATIAEQFGFSLGGIGSVGGFFQGDNIIEFLKSRSMVDETLLTEVEIAGEKVLIVDRYIAYNNLREKWASKDPKLADLQFRDTIGVFRQDSLMATFYKAILRENLVIEKLDKKLNVITIEVETASEVFSKVFAEALIKNATDFYIQTRTQKAKENLDVLTHQVDSVRRELNEAISGVAAATDANPNPNRAFQSLRVRSQLHTVDVQANTAILTELVKNQELAKITLRNEKPVIQVLDRPILPLENDKLGKLKALVIGGFLGGFLACLALVLIRLYRQIMSGDLA
ncbi:Wzz/FepE/Etk N-terminal domain-containing protein [Parapedobacter sp. 10938]|uniref:Wzz/FepE/Etk N-terminal domain-containing protein n=1 Tax=Parapedobacter flavus TaxID=3110225 RepID=UPI002DB959E8|nr:Wzz/FepE/Etk N-terminal domain-containing protein [Parapedobacter sp. 10938]MEC3879550.1 Wzz/FepE/Etk N-terminal domain-containing protein [Parapedobacter sp. 10938]